MSADSLHIVNGSAAGTQLKAAGIPGSVLAWDDVLHEGPVPANLELQALSKVRAKYIHDCGWATREMAEKRFARRDATLLEAAASQEVVLWSTFELYDQLHLLQLLDWFEQQSARVRRPSVIFIWDYFSSLSSEDLAAELDNRQLATKAQGELGAALWAAFRSPDPLILAGWAHRSTSELPFMHKALLRLLEEYPSVTNGLTRTQSQILQVLELEPDTPSRLFAACQALESEAFMGDWSFWRQLALLAGAPQPVLHVLGQDRFQYPTHFGQPDEPFLRQVLELTDYGREVVLGGADFFTANPYRLQIGGVTLDAANDWRWDAAESRILPVN